MSKLATPPDCVLDSGQSVIYRLVAQASLKGKCVLIAGPTSSGRTHFLDAVLAMRPEGDSILVLEDIPELKLCPSDKRLDTSGGRTIASLPDRPGEGRLVIDEIRDSNKAKLAFRFAESGLPCLATIPASSTKEAWELLAYLAGVGVNSAKRAFSVVILMERSADGTRFPKTAILGN